MSEEKVEYDTYSYCASLFPLTTGRFEITFRCRLKDMQESESYWSGTTNDNIIITVLPCPLNSKTCPFRPGISREMIRWFETLLDGYAETLPFNQFITETKDKQATENMIA